MQRLRAKGPAFAQQPIRIQGDKDMWKLALGFIAFAALSLFVIFQAGDKVDMSGEKHGTEAVAPAPAGAASAKH
jgi:hypothetical protein